MLNLIDGLCVQAFILTLRTTDAAHLTTGWDRYSSSWETVKTGILSTFLFISIRQVFLQNFKQSRIQKCQV
jgi:hypothetical protein